jgi:hypothetical protein
MKSNARLFCLLCLLPLALFLPAGESRAQGTGDLEARIAKLRQDERHLELERAEIQDLIQKAETKDESNRPKYVIGLFNGFSGVFSIATPREEAERRIAVRVLIGELTIEQAVELNRVILKATRAFPQAARVILSKIEKELADTKKELLALLNQRDRLRTSAGGGGQQPRDPGGLSVPDITGTWTDHLGRTITFRLIGDQVTGTCICNNEGAKTTINGTLSGNILEGEYSQPALSIRQYQRGQLRFNFNANGTSWSGEWWDANGAKGGVWNGSRTNVKR